MANVTLRYKCEAMLLTLAEIERGIAPGSHVSISYLSAGRYFDHVVDDTVANAVQDCKDLWASVGVVWIYPEDPTIPLEQQALQDIFGPDLRIIDGNMCGRLTNNSGATILLGTVLMVDSVNEESALPITGPLEEKNIGVCAEDSENGEAVWIVGLHVMTVRCSTGPIILGAFLDPSSTAGVAHDHVAPEPGVFAVALTAKGSGTGNVKACYTRAELF